jgi:hypothetical protein
MVTLPPAGPVLSYVISGNSLALFWPAQGSEGYERESSPRVANSPWTKVTMPPIPIAGQKIVTVTITGDQAYFRLRKE